MSTRDAGRECECEYGANTTRMRMRVADVNTSATSANH